MERCCRVCLLYRLRSDRCIRGIRFVNLDVMTLFSFGCIGRRTLCTCVCVAVCVTVVVLIMPTPGRVGTADHDLVVVTTLPLVLTALVAILMWVRLAQSGGDVAKRQKIKQQAYFHFLCVLTGLCVRLCDSPGHDGFRAVQANDVCAVPHHLFQVVLCSHMRQVPSRRVLAYAVTTQPSPHVPYRGQFL